MNSPRSINYETRPIKFTERKMLLASLLKICNFFGNEYQYIGFGGLSFTDFKLFHKELHINELISIEGGNFEIEKLHFNSPFSFVRIIKDSSINALNSIDLTKKTLIWLDYDGALDNYMFDDLTTLFSKLPIGSIYLFTCNRELKDKESTKEYTKEQFQDKFGNLIPFDVSNKDFTTLNNYKTIRTMLSNLINNILKDRSLVENETIKFNQLFNLTYQEYRGANMLTYGGVITDNSFDIGKLNLSDLEFINKEEDSYKLEIPNLTLKEIDLVNKNFEKEEELLKMKIINEKDLNKYKKTYKYLPNFFDVRL